MPGWWRWKVWDGKENPSNLTMSELCYMLCWVVGSSVLFLLCFTFYPCDKCSFTGIKYLFLYKQVFSGTMSGLSIVKYADSLGLARKCKGISARMHTAQGQKAFGTLSTLLTNYSLFPSFITCVVFLSVFLPSTSLSREDLFTWPITICSSHQ